MKNRKILIFLLSFYVLSFNSKADDAIYADPDNFRSMMKWTSDALPMICIGENISLGRFSLGGMIEVRNEKRFNQEFFPNHNWRGIGKFQVLLFTYQIKNWQFSTLSDIRHESAHPTMGIVENTDKAYELIYDDVYRRMILNAVSIGNSAASTIGKNTITFRVHYHFLFLSKNTPELTGGKLTEGHGLSFGAQWQHELNKSMGIYLSLYDRYIFKSIRSTHGNVYCGNGAALQDSIVDYPIIHSVNTAAVKSGLMREFGKKGRKFGIFLEYLYGNPFGFIDSRDKRSIKSLGFEFFI